MASPISIIGGGVIGLTTAWALVKKGHDVRLIEASDKPGSGASFANGGQLSYRYVSPLADAGIPMQALGWLMQNDAPLRLRLRMEPHQWRWLYAFLRACRASVNQQNTQRLLRLAMHSREVLTAWREQDSLADFSWRQNGKLVAFRSQSIFDHARHHLADPQAQQVLAADQLATLDPALANTPFVGGIYTAGEEVGDCYHFCLALEARLRASGQCHFITGHPVSQIIHSETQVTALRIAGNELPVDKLIICAGYQSPALALPGIRLPVYPLKGYSLSVPSEATSITPSISLTDYEKKIVYARLGRQLRIAAKVDINGFDNTVDEKRIASIRTAAKELFPHGGNYEKATAWAGMRPATPTSVPVISATPYRNLWLNVGHGALGFTLACGSASLVSTMIDGGEAPLDINDFRYG